MEEPMPPTGSTSASHAWHLQALRSWHELTSHDEDSRRSETKMCTMAVS